MLALTRTLIRRNVCISQGETVWERAVAYPNATRDLNMNPALFEKGSQFGKYLYLCLYFFH
jgi:hypothetical protein